MFARKWAKPEFSPARRTTRTKITSNNEKNSFLPLQLIMSRDQSCADRAVNEKIDMLAIAATKLWRSMPVLM
ncbi:hypothetical protein [Methanosarcina horonobensis]|uniref:hypothetical protein n=1 Tax=Methanosarcina horonobensis TaxID=418008 RepID=UPI000AD70893|nr:hypothetical protein [Methanosarcina horonobensis]